MASAPRSSGSTISNNSPAPASQAPSAASRPVHLDSAASTTLCRNIVIHGSCRYQDKGCRFYHGEDKKNQPQPQPQQQSQPDGSNGARAALSLRPDTPTFHPGAAASGTQTPTTGGADSALSSFLTPQTNNPRAAVFVPRGATASPARELNTSAAVFHVGGSPLRQHATLNATAKGSPAATNFVPASDTARVDANPYAAVNPYDNSSGGADALAAAAAAADMYYARQQGYQQPLQYHLYSSLAPNRKALKPNERSSHDFFLNDKLRETLQRKQEASLQTLAESSLPQHVLSYHSLVPLDRSATGRSTRSFGYTTWLYKAINRSDGSACAIRRVEGFRLSNEASIAYVERWKKVCSSAVVEVKEAFTTRAFGDSSICFVHALHPTADTLFEQHFSTAARKFAGNAIIGEPLLWSYLIQLVSGLRAIHAQGLACRVVDLSKILVTDKNRVRFGSCGVVDVLSASQDDLDDVLLKQRQDIWNLGACILSIAVNDAGVDATKRHDLTKSAGKYSTELDSLLLRMLQGGKENGSEISIDELVHAVAPHALTNLDSALQYNDTLEGELARETENGRLVRLMSKLGFINERPEYDGDQAWSEAGGRYMLKLFRDYVFHQVDEQGNPVIDLAHVLTCLNKLDAGIDERITLVSRDEATCMIVSYRDLKQCAQQAFSDLRRRPTSQQQPQPQQQSQQQQQQPIAPQQSRRLVQPSHSSAADALQSGFGGGFAGPGISMLGGGGVHSGSSAGALGAPGFSQQLSHASVLQQPHIPPPQHHHQPTTRGTMHILQSHSQQQHQLGRR
ncbi:PAB-dependent poly(A)-specific ribonuclease subunit 3 [Savitreella phatthalungensis]